MQSKTPLSVDRWAFGLSSRRVHGQPEDRHRAAIPSLKEASRNWQDVPMSDEYKVSEDLVTFPGWLEISGGSGLVSKLLKVNRQLR